MIYEKRYLPTYKSGWKSFVLLGLILGIYLLQNTPIVSSIDGFLLSYVIIPILWAGIVVLLISMRHLRPVAGIRQTKVLNQWALIFAGIYIVIMLFSGIVFGFGKSPYNRSIRGMFLNLFVLIAPLIGREFVRGYLVNNISHKNRFLNLVLISILMTFLNLSFGRYTSIDLSIRGLETIGQFISPELANNILATYLVYLGGPLTSIIYLGVIQSIHFLTPYLPNLTWIISALVGTLTPIFFVLVLHSIYKSLLRETKKLDNESPFGWMVTSIASILIIWFSLGVFSIYPSVIATGSMEPLIKPGDIILINRITNMEGIDALEVGDIIQFKSGDILISHRIVDINNNDEGKEFITKGDNNPGIDSETVKTEDVKGTVDHIVPKLGLPTLFLRSISSR